MRDRTYHVYIMSSPSRTLYTGVTNNLERRVLEHKEQPGSFTARYKVTSLVYYEEFGEINDAIAPNRRSRAALGMLRFEKGSN